jgi:hypothetical protein
MNRMIQLSLDAASPQPSIDDWMFLVSSPCDTCYNGRCPRSPSNVGLGRLACNVECAYHVPWSSVLTRLILAGVWLSWLVQPYKEETR